MPEIVLSAVTAGELYDGCVKDELNGGLVLVRKYEVGLYEGRGLISNNRRRACDCSLFG